MLPTTSPARGGGGQKSSPKTREQCLLLTFVAFLVVGTFTFVFLLPGSQANVPVPSTPYPDVRVRDDPLPQRRPDVTPQKNSEESSRFYRETEDRLSLILERISSRENRLEKVLRRLEQRFADPEDREPVPLPDGPTSQASAATTTTSSSSHANENIGPVRDVRESSETPKQKRVAEDTEKLAAVKEAMEHAWGNYKRYAWGFDELQPLTKSGKDWLGSSATIVDSLDTLWIMGMRDEFNEARDWIKDNLDFSTRGSVSFFETTIRALGGLLSAYHFSGDELFLDKAEDLGSRLLRAFNTKHGIPYASVNLRDGKGDTPSWTGGRSVLSEIGTVQLEFLYLAYVTRKPEYAIPALKVFLHLDQIPRPQGTMGLHSLYVDLQSGQFSGSRWSLGALGDSFYEYLLKMYLITGSEHKGFRRMYDESSQLMHEKVILQTKTKLTYVAEVESGRHKLKMDHLVCFAGAMFSLGAAGETKERDFHTGEEITRTCREMYNKMPTGIAPEISIFDNDDLEADPRAKHYLLRPETVESLFVLYRLTGEQKYRDWGWEIFMAIEKYCRVTNGYSGIRDVTVSDPKHDNQQQSFFLAETLKYLYLLFTSSDVIPLDEYVFNTEAHPLPVMRDLGDEFVKYFPPTKKD